MLSLLCAPLYMKQGLRILLGTFSFVVITFLAHAQGSYDTVKIMTYNTGNYGFPATVDCPALISANKHIWLRTIVQYAEPDILGMEKMDATPASFTADTVIARVLDSVCAGCYGHTPFTNNSGYGKEDMLYFKTAKFGWLSTTTIFSADNNISDINLHTLFYKSRQLAVNHDTVFLHIILVHLLSGSGNASDRSSEVAGAMSWLNGHVTGPGNYIFMGDMNTQSSNESCFQQLINSGNQNIKFFDPPNQLGNWDTEPDSFAHYLTQSTRTTDPGDCSAVSGMDDRFDHLLCSAPIMQGTQAITYVPASYHVIGQDGLHVNKALTDNPVNTSVPSNVLNALYYMSEHLPVIMQLAIDTTDSISTGITSQYIQPEVRWSYNTLVNHQLEIKTAIEAQNCEIRVYDLTGRLLSYSLLNNFGATSISVSHLANGVYLLNILQQGRVVQTGKFVKIQP